MSQTAMNKKALKHFQNHQFSFVVHAMNGKRTKNRRIESKTMKWNSIPSELASFTPPKGEREPEFEYPPCLVKGNSLGFSWRDVHSTLTNILIPIGNSSMDRFSLKQSAREWIADNWEAAKTEISEVAEAFIGQTGFYSPFTPTVSLNGNGSYSQFKVLSAGDVRCIQIQVILKIQEPVQFLCEDQFSILVDSHTSPLWIGKYSHIENDDQEWEELMQIYRDAKQEVSQ
jgi:hypothetical protein